MRFFSGVFPYTNLNNLNLDWIVDKVKNLIDQVEGVEEATEAAQAAADAAQAAADTAIEAVEALPDFEQLTSDVAILKTTVNRELLYFNSQPISPATSAQLLRIPQSGTDGHITENSVVLAFDVSNPVAVSSDITWTSYNGYIVFTGSARIATSANVVIGNKNN